MCKNFRNNKIAWLSAVSVLSMAALLCLQIYFLYGNYKKTYDEFVAAAREALQEACDEEQNMQKFFLSKQLASSAAFPVATAITMDSLAGKIKQVGSHTISSVITIDSSGHKTIRTAPNAPPPPSGRTIDSIVKRAKKAISSPTVINVNSKTGVDLNRLDTLYRQALEKRGLHINYRLEAKRAGSGEVRSLGEHRKGSEIKLDANNVHMMSSTSGIQHMNIVMVNEQVSAFAQYTPLSIFKKMLGILLISTLLFFVILYCLVAQLRVIRRQKTAAKMKNDFIANFTHELKTPIAVVYAALDNIERNPGQTAAAAEAGKTQLKRLSDSVEKILSLSVEEHNRLELHREETPMYEWLASLLEPFRLRNEKEVTFELAVEPPDATAFIDRTHFANALNNIIDNAIKYSGAQVHIAIACRKTPDGLRIAIHDNGFGIMSDDLKRIFDRFYRVKNTAEKVKGFGLGLNYAKTIVELHGGALSAESEAGKGSTFVIEVE